MDIYIAEQGDTLYDIARRFGTDVITLARYNGIADPDHIQVGQIIRIPDEIMPDRVKIHIIRNGDTLYSLAKKYNTTVGKLASLNGIQDPDVIEAGAVLRLPDGSAAGYHTVMPGDSLWKIAEKHGTTVAALINKNRLCDPSDIRPGMKLILP